MSKPRPRKFRGADSDVARYVPRPSDEDIMCEKPGGTEDTTLPEDNDGTRWVKQKPGLDEIEKRLS